MNIKIAIYENHRIHNQIKRGKKRIEEHNKNGMLCTKTNEKKKHV